MSKKLFTIAAAAALVISAGQVARATHFSQPTVDAIEGSGPGTFNGSILGSVDTADWYTLLASAGASVSLETTAATYDTHLALYQSTNVPAVGDLRSSYTLIASDDDGGLGTLSLINLGGLAAGYYVVVVEEFGGSGGSYTLSISGQGISAIDAAVPEPATLALMSVGGLGLVGGAIRRRRNKQSAV